MLNSKLSRSCLHLEGNVIFVISRPLKGVSSRPLSIQMQNVLEFCNALRTMHTKINHTSMHKQKPVLETVIRKRIAIRKKPQSVTLHFVPGHINICKVCSGCI